MNTSNELNPDVNIKQFSWNEKELQEFRKIVLDEEELHRSRTDDIFLLSFLRARKYNKERALKLLKNYYSTRKKYSNVFRDLRPSAMEVVMQMSVMVTARSESDRVIIITKSGNWDPLKADIVDVVRYMLLLLDLELNEHPIQVNGIIVISDLSMLSWRQIMKLTPKAILLILSCLYQSVPINYKAVHFINTNKYFRIFASILFPFLPHKLKKRIHIHESNIETFQKSLDIDCIPSEYGGNLPPIDVAEYIQKLKDNEDFFVENEKYWTEEHTT